MAVPRISIIVPVYNDARNLGECLAALRAAATADSEVIVVDDASTDDSPTVAERAGTRLVRLQQNSGPAAVRNRGVAIARGEILFFVDSDVAVAPDAVRRVLAVFGQHPDLAAVFGSYDATPRAPGLISQYKNLLHHFVHQQGNPEAVTFWAGCGAVRRAPFTELGGFDEGAFGRAIEDIELGYRLRRAGHRIRLDKNLLGTHLKAWTLTSLLRTDILVRAVPWSRLILKYGAAPKDLNLKTGQRVSAGLVLLALACVALAPFRPVFLVPAAGALLGVIGLNRALYGFFLRRRGAWFTAGAIPLHLLYYVYSSLSFLAVWLSVQTRRRARSPRS
jgi:glycosyltransferase involved in cell wall biosynthesis